MNVHINCLPNRVTAACFIEITPIRLSSTRALKKQTLKSMKCNGLAMVKILIAVLKRLKNIRKKKIIFMQNDWPWLLQILRLLPFVTIHLLKDMILKMKTAVWNPMRHDRSLFIWFLMQCEREQFLPPRGMRGVSERERIKMNRTLYKGSPRTKMYRFSSPKQKDHIDAKQAFR